MKDEDKKKAELLAELKEMRQLASELKKPETMLKQAEESLKEEAIRRRILVEQSRDGIVVLDQHGKVYEANQRYAEMLGYSPEEVLQLHVWDWDTQWTREQLLEMVRTVDESGDHFETFHRRKDGTYYDVEISTNGAMCGGQKMVFCVCRDITERKQSEEALRQSEALLNATQRLTKVGGWEWDVQKETMYWTQEIYRIHELTPNEIEEGSEDHIQRSLKCYDPGDRPVIQNAFESCAKKGKAYDLESPFTTAKGRKIWIRTTAEPLRENGTIIKVIGTIMDITERKQAEEALSESKRFLQDVFDGIQDGISVLDVDFNIIQVNEWIGKMYASDMPLLGKKCYRVYQKRESICPWCPTISTIKTGEAKTETVPYPSSDMPTGWIEVSSFPIKDEHSNIVGIIEHVKDITERKQAEEEKATLETQLRQSQRLETIGTLAGGISHDFNNILGIIIGNAELAIDDVPSWNPAHFNLKEIKIASLRAKDIVRQLLTFSRNMDLKKQPLNLIPVLKESLKFLRSTIPTTIEIRQNIQATDKIIMADPTQIHQVMMNLCANAAQAMEKNGGVLSIDVEDVALDADAADIYSDLPRGPYVKLTVSDTGPGIDPEIRDRVFDPYFTTKDVGRGSGMGLAVVHGIVKNHNGAISVVSEPGKGAAFTIVFPLAGEKYEREIETMEKRPTGTETILFVDDEESIVTIGRQMLERLGYTVETAMTPQDALELFRDNPGRFDLIITDMTMPQMTGEALFEEIKVIHKDMPVIVTTGYSSLIDEERAKKIGLAAYIMKPIKMSEIASTIRNVLDGQKDIQ